MSNALVLAVILASLAPMVSAQWLPGEGAAAPQAFFGWSLCPWMVLAGLPRRKGKAKASSILSAFAFAAPILALAWVLDHAASAGLSAAPGAWQAALATLACAGALAFAAQRAAGDSRWYGFLWLLLVLVAPILGWLVSRFSEAESMPGSLPAGSLFSDLSPLAFCMRLSMEGEGAVSLLSLASLGACLALLLAAAEYDRRTS